MHYIKIILLLWLWACGLAYGQTDTIIYNSYHNDRMVTLKIYQHTVAQLDTAFLGDYVGYTSWDTSLVSRAEVSTLKAQLQAAYSQTVWVNPYFTPLGTDLQNDEKVVYCWFRPDAGRYDSLCLSFKDTTTAGRAVYFLANNQAWQPVLTETTSTAYNIKAKITQPGFYALFKPRAQAFGPGAYFSSYPNPFNPVAEEVCHLCYFLETDAEVTVRIFTKTGDEVFMHTYRRGENGGIGSSSGWYLNTVTLDGRNKQGRLVDNGGYLCKITVKDKYTRTWKIGVRR
jgi:hypothetical protein